MTKKLLVAVLLATTTLLGCNNLLYNALQDAHTFGRVSGKELYYHPDFDRLNDFQKIAKYIKAKVQYSLELDDTSSVSNPEETLRLGYGTCAEYAVLFMNIAYYGMGIELDIVAVMASRAVVDGGLVDHAMVAYGDTVIEPMYGYESSMKIGYRYGFWEVFRGGDL